MEKNIRREIAEGVFVDPKSPSFLNKTQSMIEAGYSESYAKVYGGKVLENINLTDKALKNFETFAEQLPDLVRVTKRKIQQLAKDNKISAKDYSAVLRQIELIAKFAGILKQSFERREVLVKVSIPVSKCPDCGKEMDIMQREYESATPTTKEPLTE